MAVWKSCRKPRLTIDSAVKNPAFTSEIHKWSNPSHCYDRSVAIWPQNRMSARPFSQNPYDATSAKSTMTKKFATGNIQAAEPMGANSVS